MDFDKSREVLEELELWEDFSDLFTWKHPSYSIKIFASGLILYVLNHVLKIRFLTLLGFFSLLQILAYRVLKYAQEKNFGLRGVDIKDITSFGPNEDTLTKFVRFVLLFFQEAEKKVKVLAIRQDYYESMKMLSVLMFLGFLGTLISAADLLLITWILAFTVSSVSKVTSKLF
eukprot:snap_masked-scaffold_11-processed-gene-7.22-mRNA-1 protein AED:0.79 eAED:1.00 QI:0/-1/0/1/-1/1/1/0/172